MVLYNRLWTSFLWKPNFPSQQSLISCFSRGRAPGDFPFPLKMSVGGVIIRICLGSQIVKVSWVWFHLFLGDNLKADLLVSGSEVSSSSCVLGIFLGFGHLTVSCYLYFEQLFSVVVSDCCKKKLL